MNRLWKFALTMTLLSSSVLAALIQSPIPPSSRENYLLDSDGDGRLDHVSIKFLGAISGPYLNQMVDSLTFDWVDSAETLVHEKISTEDLRIDSKENRRVVVDLLGRQKRWLVQTGLKLSSGYESRKLGNFQMFLSNGSRYAVKVQDRMEPVLCQADLKIHRNQKIDSLNVKFSEPILLKKVCTDLLQYKSVEDGVVSALHAKSVVWGSDSTSALLELDGDASRSLSPRDSIRLHVDCTMDYADNAVSKSTKFIAVNGYYALDFEVGSMVTQQKVSQGDENLPIFQLLFRDSGSDCPNASEWGVAMDVLTPEFESAIKTSLNQEKLNKIDYSKVLIQYSVKIYTNLGEYVVGTTAEILGNDSRFENTAKRMFLRWNLMDGNRRRVGTGAYIANFAVTVLYDGTLVYRSDMHHGSATKVFGVKRR